MVSEPCGYVIPFNILYIHAVKADDKPNLGRRHSLGAHGQRSNMATQCVCVCAFVCVCVFVCVRVRVRAI